MKDMKLEKVLGFTTNGRNSFLVQPNTGNLIYVAGCIVVVLNPKTRGQSHLITNSKQSIITLAISQAGQYLAAANCGNLKHSTIYIWDLKKMTQFTEFVGHEFEISSMCFSTNGQYLVSVGSHKSEITLSVWDWRRQLRLVNHKETTKITARIRAISFASDDTYFVTVGENQVKYWYLNWSETGTLSIDCQNATLGEQKARSFCDVKCGRGPEMSESTFCLTKDGLLCELNKRRLLHKWVDLRTTRANCLAVSDNIIVIGCANGISRCFNTSELRFLKNLPRPHSLGLDIAKINRQQQHQNQHQEQPPKRTTQSVVYPSIIAIGLEENLNTISCVYNDRSLYSWDLNDPSGKVAKIYSALYHSSCIWGIDTYPTSTTTNMDPPQLPLGSFITCSSDDTLRIWNPDATLSNSKGSRSKNSKFAYPNQNPFSDELCKIVFTDSTYKYLCDLDGGSGSEDRIDLNYDSNEGLRCLRISPSGKQVAIGNRSGAIRIYDFELDAEIKNIAAHDAEVLCLEYSDPKKFSGYCYLASSSRDKLIHLFDASNNYAFLQTIDDHLSSITAVRFVTSRAQDCLLQLVSCGADQRIIFRNGVKTVASGSGGGGGAGSQQLNFITDQHIKGKTTFYDMQVDSESSCLMTACQDRMIRLFNVAQVRYQSAFKGSQSDTEGTLIKIALDPSCTFLAASSTDKTISVYDYQRGECLASVVYGLSDLITDMKFSPDGRHLVACSGDGCIFIWKSPTEIANGNGCLSFQTAATATQLSSLCSSESLTKPITTIDDDDNKLGQEDVYADLGPPSPARGLKQHGSSPMELTNTHKSRYQVQNATATTLRTPLNLNSMVAEEDNYIMGNANKSDDSNDDNDNDYATLQPKRASGTGSQLVREPRHSLDQMARLAKAKLFQSRENLERITLREKFLNEGLAHDEDHREPPAKLQVRRMGRHQPAKCNGNDNGHDSCVGGPTNSSLSGLFNTKLNGISSTSRLNEELGAFEVGQGNGNDPGPRSMSNTSPRPVQNPLSNNNNNSTAHGKSQAIIINSDSGNNLRLASPKASSKASGDDDELSSDVEQQHGNCKPRRRKQINGASNTTAAPSSLLLSRANRPITPPKPSPHRQIRRNAASQSAATSAGTHSHPRTLTGNSPVGGTSQRLARAAINSSGSNSFSHDQSSAASLGRTRAAANCRHQLNLSTTNTASSTGSATLRSSRSECDLDSCKPLMATTTIDCSHWPVSAKKLLPPTDKELDDSSSFYCEKLNLSKLTPASVPLSQELCQYVVDELETLSKYATRLHQRLLATGNAGADLSDMVSRGVQNSIDILSIVPPSSPRGSNQPAHHQRYQSQVNVSPISMLPSCPLSSLSRRKQSENYEPTLRRPASSNVILGTLNPKAHSTPSDPSQDDDDDDGGGHDSVEVDEDDDGMMLAKAARRFRSSDNHLDQNYNKQQQQQHHYHPDDSQVVAASSSGVCGQLGTGNGGVSGNQVTTTPSTLSEPSGEPSGGQQQAERGNNSNNNNQLNLDQVLEAYSDRLFRMVQERMAAEKRQQSVNTATIESLQPASCLDHKLLVPPPPPPAAADNNVSHGDGNNNGDNNNVSGVSDSVAAAANGTSTTSDI